MLDELVNGLRERFEITDEKDFIIPIGRTAETTWIIRVIKDKEQSSERRYLIEATYRQDDDDIFDAYELIKLKEE